MDSWLHDEEVVDCTGSDSDSEEEKAELESRLYAIVHHNDLSQPLPPILAKHYSVDCVDNGDVVVTLKNSIDDVISEESKLCSNPESNSDKVDDTVAAITDDEIVIISESDQNQQRFKRRRFRYSDINLDNINETSSKEVNNSTATMRDWHSETRVKNKIESSTPDINYFRYDKQFFNKRRFEQYMNLKIPQSYKRSDWKTESNASFISVGLPQNSDVPQIIQKMTDALKMENPQEKTKKLQRFAQLLYRRNMRTFRRKEKKKRKKTAKNCRVSEIDTSLELNHELQDNSINKAVHDNSNNQITLFNLAHEMQDNCVNSLIQDNVVNHKKEFHRMKCKDMLNESIVLNTTPFKSDPPVIDLTLNCEGQSPFESNNNLLTSKSGKLLKSHLPTKWTKKMIKFYTKPSKKKLETDIKGIINNLKRTSIASEWWVDPRDRTGFYHRTPQGKVPNRRCSNCRERDHYVKDCPKPKKIPACHLCGEPFHSDYSCPNKICLKCGVPISHDTYAGDCSTCYYSTFDYNLMCEICGSMVHRGENCPDLWRSFHATTGGEKNIPGIIIENKRKYCCNCARRDHFSHDCPFPLNIEQQTTPFITNYSGKPGQKMKTEIVFPNYCSGIVTSNDGCSFVEYLKISTNTDIKIEKKDKKIFVEISGLSDQISRAKYELEDFMNSKKRKRQDPLPKRKRQRIRY